MLRKIIKIDYKRLLNYSYKNNMILWVRRKWYYLWSVRLGRLYSYRLTRVTDEEEQVSVISCTRGACVCPLGRQKR